MRDRWLTHGDGKITDRGTSWPVEPIWSRFSIRPTPAPGLPAADTAKEAAPAPFDPKLDQISLRVVRADSKPRGRFRWGVSEDFPGYADPPATRHNPPDLQDPDLQSSGAGLRSARRGCRQQRSGLDGARRHGHLASFDVRKCKDSNRSAKG